VVYPQQTIEIQVKVMAIIAILDLLSCQVLINSG